MRASHNGQQNTANKHCFHFEFLVYLFRPGTYEALFAIEKFVLITIDQQSSSFILKKYCQIRCRNRVFPVLNEGYLYANNPLLFGHKFKSTRTIVFCSPLSKPKQHAIVISLIKPIAIDELLSKFPKICCANAWMRIDRPIEQPSKNKNQTLSSPLLSTGTS